MKQSDYISIKNMGKENYELAKQLLNMGYVWRAFTSFQLPFLQTQKSSFVFYDDGTALYQKYERIFNNEIQLVDYKRIKSSDVFKLASQDIIKFKKDYNKYKLKVIEQDFV